MQKNRYKSKWSWAIALATLGTLISIGAALAALDSDRQKNAPNPEDVDTVAVKTRTNPPGQTPKPFVPTEQVTADQAIAFPSDI